MSRYWSELVGQLTPYVPGEQPQVDNLVKLNTNESPYPPSPKVEEAIAAVGGDALRLYPDPQSVQLRQAIAERHGLELEQVFVGNGSDEVLGFAFSALLKHDAPLYFPDITYSFYPVWAQLSGVQCQKVPVADDFKIEPQAYPADNGGVIIPNPNAPTGILMPLDDVRRLLERCPDSVVIVDEAYIDFGGESAVGLIGDYDNLLVVQTVSKSRALAGLRVGYAMGHRDLIEGLDRVKNSFNSYPLDVLAQTAVVASLSDEEYFQHSCEQVIASRESLTASLSQMGFTVLPSSANFIFASHEAHSAQALFHALRERGVIVRYFDKPRIDNYLRITVGTDQQCLALLDNLQDILA